LQAGQLDGGQFLLGLECGHEASVHGVSFLSLPAVAFTGAPFFLHAIPDSFRRGRDPYHIRSANSTPCRKARYGR
jgi:hypothetical protein